MPVLPCGNKMYKIGEKGNCQFKSKKKAEAGLRAYYANKRKGNSGRSGVR